MQAQIQVIHPGDVKLSLHIVAHLDLFQGSLKYIKICSIILRLMGMLQSISALRKSQAMILLEESRNNPFLLDHQQN